MRAPVRLKKGGVVVAVDTRGGLAEATSQPRREPAGSHVPIDLPSSVERLGTLTMKEAIAKADVKAGRKPEKTPKAFREQGARLRKNMMSAGPVGAGLVRSVNLALVGQARRFLRTAERAHLDARPYVERLGAYLAVFILDGVCTPAALVRAGSSAISDALADMILDHLVAQDPTVGIGATRSRVIDGARVANALPTFDALMKLYTALRTLAGKEASLAVYFNEKGREAERERERMALRAAWAAPRPALVQPAEQPPDTHDARAQDVAVAGTSPLRDPPGSEEHGAEPAPYRHGGAGSADDLVEEEEEKPLEAAWCAIRMRQVPAWLAGKPRPSPASGPGWVALREEEGEVLRKFDEAMAALQRGAALKGIRSFGFR